MDRRWMLSGAAAVVGLGILGAVGWVVFGTEEEEVRERRFRAESACLFTGDQGLQGAAAQPVWAGMQRASAETRIQVSYLSTIGPQTVQNAGSYLGGLLQQRCELLIAVDEAPVAAVSAQAAKYPHQRFVIIRGAGSAGEGGKAANVSVVDGAESTVHALLVERFEE